MFFKKLILLISFLFVFSFSFADDDAWTLIPVGSWDKAVEQIKNIWNKSKKVWENYNKYAEKNANDAWTAFASGVFSWDTIFAFLKHIVKVLSELWLVIWALMIIYAGYKYATGVFTWDASKGWKDAVKWAIYWVLIIIFSYAIMKILLSMFW